MTVIYLDLLFLLNFIANYLILLLTARISGHGIHRWMYVLSATLGASYAAFTLIGFSWLEYPLCKIGCGILMVIIAFGKAKDFLRTVILFFGVSAALGGIIWAIELLGKHKMTLQGGVLYSTIDIRLLLVLLMLCYTVLSIFGKRTFMHKKSELIPVKIIVGKQTLQLTALLDTGNTLTDPATNRPVLVVEREVCNKLLPIAISLEFPIEAFEKLNKAGYKGFRLIPYRAVGVNCGLLLSMQADKVVIGKQEYTGMIIALSPTSISDGGGYQALLGGTL